MLLPAQYLCARDGKPWAAYRAEVAYYEASVALGAIRGTEPDPAVYTAHPDWPVVLARFEEAARRLTEEHLEWGRAQSWWALNEQRLRSLAGLHPCW